VPQNPALVRPKLRGHIWQLDIYHTYDGPEGPKPLRALATPLNPAQPGPSCSQCVVITPMARDDGEIPCQASAGGNIVRGHILAVSSRNLVQESDNFFQPIQHPILHMHGHDIRAQRRGVRWCQLVELIQSRGMYLLDCG
jgi:hypothetical protein